MPHPSLPKKWPLKTAPHIVTLRRGERRPPCTRCGFYWGTSPMEQHCTAQPALIQPLAGVRRLLFRRPGHAASATPSIPPPARQGTERPRGRSQNRRSRTSCMVRIFNLRRPALCPGRVARRQKQSLRPCILHSRNFPANPRRSPGREGPLRGQGQPPYANAQGFCVNPSTQYPTGKDHWGTKPELSARASCATRISARIWTPIPCRKKRRLAEGIFMA